uniref:Uncharacterized protein n=1 Tax=Panagrolaimus sp. PS1159 TaxID=55785 RepID=A0AC35FZD9_9BILA
MTTKDEFLPSSFVKNCSQDTDNINRYSNFNLNQNSKCPILIPVQTFSKSNNDKFGDSIISGNCEEKEKPQLWNKASTDSSSKHFKETAKNHWKNNIVKNSTLCLHISTYENSVKAESGSFGDGNHENHRLNKEKNAKQILTASKFVIQNPFEFPRQQNDKKSKPELSQFKASQRLLNPNKASNNVHPMTLRSRKKNNEKELEVEVNAASSKLDKSKTSHESEKIRSKAEKVAEGELIMEELPKTGKKQLKPPQKVVKSKKLAGRPLNAISPDSTTTTATTTTSDCEESFVKEVQKMLLERAAIENDIVTNLLEQFLASEPQSPELAAATQKCVESILRRKDVEEKVAAKANKTKKND